MFFYFFSSFSILTFILYFILTSKNSKHIVKPFFEGGSQYLLTTTSLTRRHRRGVAWPSSSWLTCTRHLLFTFFIWKTPWLNKSTAVINLTTSTNTPATFTHCSLSLSKRLYSLCRTRSELKHGGHDPVRQGATDLRQQRQSYGRGLFQSQNNSDLLFSFLYFIVFSSQNCSDLSDDNS